MASVNKVILIGHLGRDPEVRHTASGSAVCNVSIATSRSWKDKQSGERVEETEWHRVTFFDRMAEVAGEYLTKGSQIYVEGRLKTRKYQDKDGAERSVTEVMADNMTMLGGKEGKEGGQERPQQRRSAAPAPSPAPAPRQQTQQRTKGESGFEDMDDDIPF